MRQKILFFINVALLIILAGLLAIVLKSPRQPASLPAREHVPAEIVEREASYQIPEALPGEKEALKRKPKDLNDVFRQYPEQDVGDNMIKTWNSVNPEDKKKLSEVVEKNISDTKEALKVSPNDTKLRNKLFISETMKKLIANNFNYKFKQND